MTGRADFLTRLGRVPRTEWFDAFQREAIETGGTFIPRGEVLRASLHSACVATTRDLDHLFDLWIARADVLEDLDWSRTVLNDPAALSYERRKAARVAIKHATDAVLRIQARQAIVALVGRVA